MNNLPFVQRICAASGPFVEMICNAEGNLKIFIMES